MMNVKIYDNDEAFAVLKKEWDSLLKMDILSNNFMSYYWAHSWWKSYRPDARLHLITVRNDELELVGIAPLMKQTTTDSRISYTCLKFIGDGTDETDHMSFILHKAYVEDAIGCILKTIQDDDGWDILELNMVQTKAVLRDKLHAWGLGNRFHVQRQDVEYAVNNLPESYEQFVGSLQPRFRTKLRSSKRKLEQKYAVEFGLHSSENQSSDLEVLFKNHASRWSVKGDIGAFARNPRRMEFYRLLTGHFYKLGWLRFFYLKLDDKVIAQQYCFEFRGSVYLLQEGFDYAYARQNVGNVLRGYVFEYCIENNKKVYDFLAFISRHKLRWSNNVGKDQSIKIYRRNIKNSIYLFKHFTIRNAKILLKRILPDFALAYLKKII